MPTKADLINSTKKATIVPDDNSLRSLPFRKVFIYPRLSTPAQVRDSHESILEIAALVSLAIKDGYKTKFTAEIIEERLKAIQSGTSTDQVWEDGDLIIDVRDLGLSGQKAPEIRRGLAHLQKRINDGDVGAVYLGEGVSRLSRDPDHILPYQLLKLLKEHCCRIRTPDGVWNPVIERDCDALEDDFEDAIDELKILKKRLFRKKKQKAARGEFVGEPILPGFYLPVVSRKPNGGYNFGIMKKYEPHALVDIQILEKFWEAGGSLRKSAQALSGIEFPFFPPDLAYMERLTSLRAVAKSVTGYKITP